MPYCFGIKVLDEYSEVYIETTNDIKKRIRQHWQNSEPFDRLLFPMGNVYSLILSIAYETNEIFGNEDGYLNQFPAKFISNRLAGRKVSGWFLQAIENEKQIR